MRHRITMAAKANVKYMELHLKNRCMEYAVAKPATKYMESISRFPPISVSVACIAIEPGPRKIAIDEKKILVKALSVNVLLFFANLPCVICHAMVSPAIINPMLLQVFAGCLIKPGLDASQNSAPTLVVGPNQPLNKARKNNVTKEIATKTAIGKTDF